MFTETAISDGRNNTSSTNTTKTLIIRITQWHNTSKGVRLQGSPASWRRLLPTGAMFEPGYFKNSVCLIFAGIAFGVDYQGCSKVDLRDLPESFVDQCALGYNTLFMPILMKSP